MYPRRGDSALTPREFLPSCPTLLLPAHALERLAVLLLIHEAARVRVALRPVAVLRVLDLRAVAHRAVPVAIPLRRIRRHVRFPPFIHNFPNDGLAARTGESDRTNTIAA